MSTEEEKAKKLKEIQDRLAEIKGEPVSSQPESENKKKKTTIEKGDVKATDEKKVEIKLESDKIKDKSKLPIAELIKEDKKKEAVSKEWSGNKIKTSDQVKSKIESNVGQKQKHKPESRALSRNRSNKILSIISIIITLCVTTYIVYTYFLSDDPEVIEAEVPVIIQDEEILNEENKVVEEEPIEDEVMQEEIKPTVNSEELVEASAKRVNAKRDERKEQIAQETEEKSPATITIKKSPVPGGFIISYSSNSNSSAASNNVKNLRNRGFNANFYYMRDKDPSGPDLYKVYLGPYGSESEAFPDFKKIIKLNDKAFILKMK